MHSLSRRRFLASAALSALGATSLPFLSRAATSSEDVTFLFACDVHACLISGGSLSPGCEQEGKTDAALLRNIAAMNGVDELRWPETINGVATGLSVAGKKIERPKALFMGGDLTDDGGGQLKVPGEGRQLRQFSSRYVEGTGPDHIHYPVYVGLGNHDLDQDGAPPNVDWYRREMRDYVELNHRSTVFYKAPLPAENYDLDSDNYSLELGPLHLVQLQRFAGDTSKGAISSLDWLARDLATYAANNKPVILFQHYGWDAFSTERWDKAKETFDDSGDGDYHWWTEEQRDAFLAVIKPYNIVALCHGHQHPTPMIYKQGSLDIIKPVAAFMGGFAVINVSGNRLNVVLAQARAEGPGVDFTTALSKVIL